jgi:hypothetical protein
MEANAPTMKAITIVIVNIIIVLVAGIGTVVFEHY